MGGKNSAQFDLYKTSSGDIIVKGKGGIGPGEPTGFNINHFWQGYMENVDNMHDEIGIRLSIISDTLSASFIDEYLAVKSDQSHVRGELNRLGTKAHEQHAWFLKSRYDVGESEQIGNCIAGYLDMFLLDFSQFGTR